jgi:hypothetical protein
MADSDDDDKDRVREAHARAYSELPEHTRAFLEGLKRKDIELFDEAINFVQSTKTMGKFAKFIVVLIIGAFVGAASFGQAIEWLWHQMAGGTKP